MARNDDRLVPNTYTLKAYIILRNASKVHTVPRPSLAKRSAIDCQGGCSISVLARHASFMDYPWQLPQASRECSKLHQLVERNAAAVEAMSRPATRCCQIRVLCRSCHSLHTDLGFCHFSARRVCICQRWPLLHLSFLIVRECDTTEWCTNRINRCLSQSLRASCSTSRWTCYLHDDASSLFRPDETGWQSSDAFCTTFSATFSRHGFSLYYALDNI